MQLISDQETLLQRVQEVSRKAHTKIQSGEVLKRLLDNHDLYAAISNRESLTIENTSMPAVDAARSIVEHFGLEA